MRASGLIGLKMVHTTAPDISGEITDILLELSLKKVAFFLADVTTPSGTAPVLFSPSVLALEDDVIRVSAHPDDIAARVDASIHRSEVPVDPADLPNMFIGPFGNTFSPSMIAALFNARTRVDRPDPPTATDGVWFVELHNHAVRAHVADIGHVDDIILDDHLAVCEGVELKIPDGGKTVTPPSGIHAGRSPDGALLLSISETDVSS